MKKKKFTEKQLEIMHEAVVSLICLTGEYLAIFLEEDEQCPAAAFIENVTKNFIGNLIYQGIHSELESDYKKTSSIYLKHLKHYFDTTIPKMIEQRQQERGEMH